MFLFLFYCFVSGTLCLLLRRDPQLPLRGGALALVCRREQLPLERRLLRLALGGRRAQLALERERLGGLRVREPAHLALERSLSSSNRGRQTGGVVAKATEAIAKVMKVVSESRCSDFDY